MSKPLVIHLVPVILLPGPDGAPLQPDAWLLRGPRRASPVVRGVEALPDAAWSWGPSVGGWLFSDDAYDAAVAAVRAAAGTRDLFFCAGCLDADPDDCDADWLDDDALARAGLKLPDARDDRAPHPPLEGAARPWLPAGSWDRFNAWTASLLERFGAPVGRAAPPMTAAEGAAVLGCAWPCDATTVARAFRRAALAGHPDRGGSAEQMKRVLAAREAIERALRGGATR